MAYSQDIRYIWPPNFVEGTSVMGANQRRIVVRVSGYTPDLDATDAVVIDKSDLIGPAGVEPTKLVIEELEWSVVGFDAALLEFDDGTDKIIARLSGAGFKDYTPFGGLSPTILSGNGDLILSTTGAAADAQLDITIVARLKA